jgi:hypothetical protein
MNSNGIKFETRRRSQGVRIKVMGKYRGARFVSFSPPERGEGRDEGSRLTSSGVILNLYRYEILCLPITLNRTPPRGSVIPVVSPEGGSYTPRMKMTTTLFRGTIILATAALCGLGQAARAADEPTALSLIKDANEYVGKDTKDKVIGIRSEKSVASVTPNIWYVVFYDHDATFKTTEVKYGAGKKIDLKHPMRQPFAYINDKNLLDQKAIKIAMAEPLLDKLTIRATQLWLENVDGVPTWRVRLWAQKLRHPNDDANVGDVSLSAEDGKVLKSDLHIDRVD